MEGSHSQVECTGLENRRPCKGSVGSNPTPSASGLNLSRKSRLHEPCVRNHALIAQLVEQHTSNVQVVGSSPTWSSISVLIGVMSLC